MRGQSRGTLRALAGICRCHLRFFFWFPTETIEILAFWSTREIQAFARSRNILILPRNHLLFPCKVFLRVYARRKQSEKLAGNMFPESSVDRDAGAGGVGVGRFWDWECWDVRNEMAGLHLYISHYRHFNDCAPRTLSIAWTPKTSLFPSQVIFSVLVRAARQAN